MKIKITKGCVAEALPRAEGEEINVADREGRQLIAMGKAVEVKEKAVLKETPKPEQKKRGRPSKSNIEE